MNYAKRTEKKNTIFYQSLEGHSLDSLIILKKYFDLNYKAIDAFCERWQINSQHFKKNLFYVVALHDIGKLTQEFQTNISHGKSSKDYPHPLFAMPLLSHIKWCELIDYPTELCVILGHHSQLYGQLYQSINSKVHFIKPEIEAHFKKLETFYDDVGFRTDFNFESVPVPNSYLNQSTRIYDEYIIPLVTYDIAKRERYRIKAVFCFFYSILQLCDDYSSAHFSEFIQKKSQPKEYYHSTLTEPAKYVYNILFSKKEFHLKLLGKFKPYLFQTELIEKKPKFGFLFAPCGRGKTEASLLWAKEIMDKFDKNKIVFALPTQTTCNAMYERLSRDELFGKKNVNLFHGKSFITIKNEQQKIIYQEDIPSETDQKMYDIIRDATFKGNIFFYPITVTTIDHLAYSFIHGYSQSDFACGNLQNSVIIFDEVHYYELHTLRILMSLFEILRKLEIPHLLMTGTAPEFIINALETYYDFTVDKEGLMFEPFYLQKTSLTIIEGNQANSDVILEIVNDFKKNNKIFIIANTVQRAQAIYRQVREILEAEEYNKKTIVYHSRFIHKDRVQKEADIYKAIESGPCIIVATQVIEISLNISCDIMYSEICPADALGQRGGRLNRSGKFWKNKKAYNLKLFEVENERPYRPQLMEKANLVYADGPISYAKIKELCDMVYEDVTLETDSQYKKCFTNNVIFGDHHRDICWGADEGKGCKIREDSFQTIEVIPFDKYEQCLNGIKNGDFLSEYKVRIPYWYVANDLKSMDNNKIFIPVEIGSEIVLLAKFKYTYEMGLILENKNTAGSAIL